MSDRELYSRLLLAKGHGYPLSYPQPPDDLPLESRTRGVQIGDVGVLTSDGGFDTFFNICRSQDDVGNRFGVPTGFETVQLHPADVLSRRLFHRPGSHVSNTRLNKRRLDVDADLDNVFSPLGAGAVVELSAVSKEAAMLLMPDGASRINLRFLDIFRQQALKHAQSWYAFLKSLGSMVENGELYLVTGLDSSSSWIVGAVETQSEDCNISLKLKAGQIGSAGGSYAWQWETSGAFADSGPRRLPGEDPSAQNQTVFLRGFRIALHSLVWRKISQAIPVVDSKRLTFFSRRWFSSFVQSQSLGSILRHPSSTQHNTSPEESGMVEYSPATLRPYHPADAINNQLLTVLKPDGTPMTAAVIHDDEWISALVEHETSLPSKAELIKRIGARYTIDFAYGGVYFVQTKVASGHPVRKTKYSRRKARNAAKKASPDVKTSSTVILRYIRALVALLLCTLLIIPLLVYEPSTIISTFAYASSTIMSTFQHVPSTVWNVARWFCFVWTMSYTILQFPARKFNKALRRYRSERQGMGGRSPEPDREAKFTRMVEDGEDFRRRLRTVVLDPGSVRIDLGAIKLVEDIDLSAIEARGSRHSSFVRGRGVDEAEKTS